MAAKKEDEIMAEYLLKGGKMLERTCRTCGCPMYEYKGKTFCVVCAERERETGGKDALQKKTKPRLSATSEGTGAVQGETGISVSGDTAGLADELVETIRDLCARIRAEEDPDRCLALMDAVKAGSEALQILHHV